MIIYLLGVLMSIFAIADVIKTREFGVVAKILISIIALVFSWIGGFAYFYAIKPIYLKTRKG